MLTNSFANPYEASEEQCRRYETDGYVTFDARAGTTSSFLETVVGVTAKEAQEHLDDCVLRSKYDMNTALRPTKVPPAQYVTELLPLLSSSCQTSSTADPRAKTPKGTGKPRRTVHAIDVHVCDSVFNKIATSPAIGELVGTLTGWASKGVGVRLLETQVWMKPPMCSVPLAFHRDTPYFGFLSPLDICTVWFTFDSIATLEEAKELGGLEYAVGSHLWSQAGGIEGVFFDKDYRSPMKKAAAEHASILTSSGTQTAGTTSADLAAPPYTVHYVTAGAGGVSIHNGMLWHGSGANVSPTKWRRGMGIHYIRSDAAFRQEYSAYDEVAKDEGTIEDGSSNPASSNPSAKRPFLSVMWAPHKQPYSLQLSDSRFPVIWHPSKCLE